VAAAALVAWAVMAALGGLQGNRDILRPVDYPSLAGTQQGQGASHARFRRVGDQDELERLMEQARNRGRPVMVDYYADWCVDCVRMERSTFADPGVAARLNRDFTLIQVDVTDPDDPGTRAIKRAHGVFGPPAMLFFDRRGREVRDLRRYGYMDRETFLDHIEPLAPG
jgi:thiol:disulfide interchange protein DsbD